MMKKKSFLSSPLSLIPLIHKRMKKYCFSKSSRGFNKKINQALPLIFQKTSKLRNNWNKSYRKHYNFQIENLTSSALREIIQRQ